ncbi:hypothetical protein K443DRAFT_14550 [Laccaria amethystina LaAM-08-1]|uniref:Uncharacterized protein n=1 Tax=Laccaria amethystina LaAM-08-1 TaxID=1095629 RepID=A0A0C9WHI6_9AGAR|nr:hypothetical protein K443DRAFT_14550 [Laccaria amethystina LaAM-08-1]
MPAPTNGYRLRRAENPGATSPTATWQPNDQRRPKFVVGLRYLFRNTTVSTPVPPSFPRLAHGTTTHHHQFVPMPCHTTPTTTQTPAGQQQHETSATAR